MERLLLELTTSLAVLNGNPPNIVHPVTPEVCSSVVGVLDSRGSCAFLKQSGRADVVVAVPTTTGCDIRDPSDDSVVLSSNTSCNTVLSSIAELRRQTFIERLKQLFQ